VKAPDNGSWLDVFGMFPLGPTAQGASAISFCSEAPRLATFETWGTRACSRLFSDGLRSDPCIHMLGRIDHPDPGTRTYGNPCSWERE
jgi:hypothetical protein